ncbi:MAG: hypothetical protein AB7I30_21090, partial [Isosphaeraceae bacterium]
LALQVGTDGPSAPSLPGVTPPSADIVFACLARDAKGRPLAGDLGLPGQTAMIDTPGEARPAVIEVKVFQDLELITLKFQLDRIPLKDFARMPVALTTLDFSGHDAPVSAEFVRFQEKDEQQKKVFPDSRPYLIRIVNHSNKDVRSLVLDKTFFDASGEALRDRSPLNFHFEPHLVQRQDEREWKEAGFFVPKGAASATFRASKVGFTDGTEWKPQSD